jgi:hypothetical protein
MFQLTNFCHQVAAWVPDMFGNTYRQNELITDRVAFPRVISTNPKATRIKLFQEVPVAGREAAYRRLSLQTPKPTDAL